MNTRNTNPTNGNMNCTDFGDRVSAWLDDELGASEDSQMDEHVEVCANCSLLVSDLIQMLDSARSLPVLSPPRDMWSEVESRLEARVLPISSLGESRPSVANVSAYTSPDASPPHMGDLTRFGLRSHNRIWLATAATVLVVVTAGVTWTAARWSLATTGASAGAVANAGASAGAKANAIAAEIASSVRTATQATIDSTTVAIRNDASDNASGNASDNADNLSRGAPSSVSRSVIPGGQNQVSFVTTSATSMIEVDAIYEKEIAALRRIVNERFADLDPITVMELKSNLATIDKAIEDSRRALRSDPGSALLSSELDRIIEAKLVLMRRVALL